MDDRRRCRSLFAVWLLLLAAAAPLAAAQQTQQPAGAPAAAQLPPAGAAAAAQPPAAGGGGRQYADQLLKRYLSNDELAAWRDEFLTRCSSIARGFSIGKSANGIDMWGVELSEDFSTAGRPNFKYIANMHGDEPSGRMLLPMLAEWLCENRGREERATRLLGGTHLWLLPTVNPDGFKIRRRGNAKGTDLNRNFPDPIELKGADLRTPRANAAPETVAIMNFTLGGHFAASANLHEGAIVANYPWDGYSDLDEGERKRKSASPDDAGFVLMAKEYAAHHAFMAKSKEFPDGITNGAQWYPVYGGMQDWNYVAAGCMAITLEVSQDKWRAEADLPSLWEENRAALLALPLAAVLGGARGIVTDAATGAPLAATLTITYPGAPPPPGGPIPFYARPADGLYARPLAPGAALLAAAADGYEPWEAEITVPPGGGGVIHNFQLQPEGRALPGGSPAAPRRGAGGLEPRKLRASLYILLLHGAVFGAIALASGCPGAALGSAAARARRRSGARFEV
ncbi:MAG: hypothetical protein J3K34DRAFT_518884 [Monoraphidium minutum]|nr:MAG: hypothetical protein J3K34DRAFT_518884 [Monoraphidium minutum]